MGNAKSARLTADQDQQAILHEEEMPERRNARKEVDRHEGKKYASLAGRQAGRQAVDNCAFFLSNSEEYFTGIRCILSNLILGQNPPFLFAERNRERMGI